MPSARVRTATTVNPGDFASCRSAYWISRANDDIVVLPIWKRGEQSAPHRQTSISPKTCLDEHVSISRVQPRSSEYICMRNWVSNCEVWLFGLSCQPRTQIAERTYKQPCRSYAIARLQLAL